MRRSPMFRLTLILLIASAALILAGCERPRPPATEAATPAATAQSDAAAAAVTVQASPTRLTVLSTTTATPLPTDAAAIEAAAATPAPIQTSQPSLDAPTPARSAPPTSAAAPSAQSAGGTGATAPSGGYVVQPGDTLFTIAQRFGTTVEALKAANGLSSDFIYVGQRLTIPTGGGSPPPQTPGTHVVQPGENLFRIALRYGVTVEALAAANNIVNPWFIYVGQRLTIPGGGPAPNPPPGRTHIVRPGETLNSIALQYGTTPQAIALANKLANPNLIFVGQTLLIP